jgi:hypothetical protein
MKVRIAIVLLASALLRADPDFVGVITTKDQSFFALTGRSEGPPQWHEIGQAYGTYTISEYRAEEQSLVLQGEKGTLVLKLKEAKVGAAQGTIDIARFLEVARAEIAKREKWNGPIQMNPRIDPSSPTSATRGLWFAVGHFDDASGNRIQRMVVLRTDGTVYDYATPSLKKEGAEQPKELTSPSVTPAARRMP